MAEGHQVCRQRSRSLAGPLSRSADWTEELERRLRSREEDGGGSSGSGEYLASYKGGGSQPICATTRSSCGQVSTCGFQDVFTGEYRAVSVSMITVSCGQESKELHVTEMAVVTSLSILKAHQPWLNRFLPTIHLVWSHHTATQSRL